MTADPASLGRFDGRLRASEWCVRTVDMDTLHRLVGLYHYSQGGANTATFRHGLFRAGSDECLGVAWWIPPTKTAAHYAATAASPRHPHGPGCDWKEVLTLSRLAIAPDVPKNAATFLMMRSVRLIRQAGDAWKCLVTYADTWRNHTGHIYRAAGWEDFGETAGEEVWTDQAGRMVARKRGQITRTAGQMRELGYVSHGRHPKIRYRLVIHSPKTKRCERPNPTDEWLRFVVGIARRTNSDFFS